MLLFLPGFPIFKVVFDNIGSCSRSQKSLVKILVIGLRSVSVTLQEIQRLTDPDPDTYYLLT
jgi:hypothetical protein